MRPIKISSLEITPQIDVFAITNLGKNKNTCGNNTRRKNIFTYAIVNVLKFKTLTLTKNICHKS